MKKILSLLSIILVLSACVTQKKMIENKIVFDKKAGKEVIFGQCSKSVFQDNRMATWYTTNYQAYEPDLALVESWNLNDKIDLRILVVFGSWCHDSKREVPRFIKIMEHADLPTESMLLYGVDREKKSPGIDTKQLDIKLVPTFIFYKGKNEIGRIIESPKQSLELDIQSILEKY